MYFFTGSSKSVIMLAGATAVGAIQTLALREYADKGVGPIPSTFPVIGNMLGSFGRTSVVAGVGIGGAALALGLYAKQSGKFVTNDQMQNMLIAYGVGAFSTGLWSYFFPPKVALMMQAPVAGQPATATAMAVNASNAAAAEWVMRQLDEGVL